MRFAPTVPALALVAAVALPAGVASAAKAPAVKVDVPAGGQVAVVVADVGKRAAKAKPKLKVAGAPAGVSVSGGVTPGGRLALAVVRPRDAATGGRVTVSVKARGKAVKARGLKRLAAALDAGAAAPKAACKDAKLGAALGRRLAGGASTADAKALGALLGRRLCGKPATAADAGVLERLGLGAPPAPPAPPMTPSAPPSAGGSPVIPFTPPPRPTPPPPNNGGGQNPGGEKPNQCSNDVDDDGDGQIDISTQQTSRPDPGCAGPTDDEAGETAVSAECAGSSGVSRGNEDRSSAFAAINSDCGEFKAYWINIAPGPIATCKSFTAESNFECAVENGDAVARAMDGKPTDMADTLIGMGGSFDCSIPATIALVRPDGSVAELVEPVGGCEGGDGPAKAACANGVDDDGDGQTDSPEVAGATDPDPGCSSDKDASEDSEIGLPGGCSVTLVTFNQDARFPGVVIEGCGTITGAWFRPPASPTDCLHQVGEGDAQACDVVGSIIATTFGATAEPVKLGGHVAEDPPCAPVTVALRRQDGAVMEGRGSWC